MIDFRWATKSAINIHFAYDEFCVVCIICDIYFSPDKSDIVNRKRNAEFVFRRNQCTQHDTLVHIEKHMI